MKRITSIGTLALMLAYAATPASAQQSQDMTTQLMTIKGLFEPHRMDCIPSEAFVEIGDSGKGFCIEKNERPAEPFEVDSKSHA